MEVLILASASLLVEDFKVGKEEILDEGPMACKVLERADASAFGENAFVRIYSSLLDLLILAGAFVVLGIKTLIGVSI